jgi:hypothetical protein
MHLGRYRGPHYHRGITDTKVRANPVRMHIRLAVRRRRNATTSYLAAIHDGSQSSHMNASFTYLVNKIRPRDHMGY